jgi:hypothetical protein
MRWLLESGLTNPLTRKNYRILFVVNQAFVEEEARGDHVLVSKERGKIDTTLKPRRHEAAAVLGRSDSH